ncbi:LuxR C-terminal-related transcriptional regulator [Lysinibacillus sp. NPDC097287]|uniref:LuxR C-terminal-related transcriptional regulator n=1 Tax=Lysinibacillus sp. NPDC097287 TaxID=3364144 RepID=UPI0038293128
MSVLLLSSKTNVPHSMSEAVERTRLYDTFSNNTLKKVTILRAPAGYGKTTLLSQWLKQTKEQIAWVSVDPADNDPIRYWTYVVHAVAHASQSELDKVLKPLFQSQDVATFEFLIDALLHEFNAMEATLHIVMDDYHLIENTLIHQMMTQFIEQLPEHVHVYLTTRTALPLPIAKWRAKQWVCEFNTDQLRFTHQEAKQFYAMKNLTLHNQETLQLIVERTEGWIAGLLLASLSTNPESERHWHMQAQPYVSEFLLQEIITTLSPPTQEFLLRTSLLNELEPSICNKLTQRIDSYELLGELEEKGLFIVRLQSTKPVFRYHHLFAEVLQSEFKRRYSVQQVTKFASDTATLLHDIGDFISAIELALQHDLFELADLWITEHLVELYLAGQTATFMRWLHQLRSDSYTVPYEMLVMGVITSLSTLDIDVASSLMQELEIRQHTEQWMDKKENEAIAYIYETVKAYAIISTGGDLQIAKEIIQKQHTKGAVPSRWDEVPMQYNIFEYKLLRTSIGSKGKLPTMEDGTAIANFFRETTTIITAFSYGVSAESLYERNLLDLAKKEVELAIQYGHQYSDPGLLIPMYLLKAKIYITEKQLISAQAMLMQVKDVVKEKHWVMTLRIMQAYCYVLAGDSKSAEMELLATKTKQPFWMLVYARLLLLKEQPEDALMIVIQTKTKAQQDHQVATIMEASVLEVICHNRIGNTDVALNILHEALEQAAPYFYIRTFLDETEIHPLLERYFKQLQVDGSKRKSISLYYLQQLQITYSTNIELDNILTPREQEVFNLLAEGVTNREIAEQLDLSEGTVRVYLSTIYSKLGVKSRTKAILFKKQ